jgi:hypothetical protein
MKNYANATKGTILLGDIQAHMIKEHSKPSTRRQDIIHPSETCKESWCPRATYHRIKACREAGDPFLKPAESIGVQLLNIFDEGHYIHDKWQKRLTTMGKLWGNWSCNFCGSIFKDQLPLPSCPYCDVGQNGLIYREVPLRAREYLIAGHADGAVPHLKSLIEIKSVGAGTVRIEAPEIYKKNTNGSFIDFQGLWKDIKEPFPSHIKQGQLYLALCSLMGLPYDRIIFIYEAKFNQGVKEFVVKYDYSVSEEVFRKCGLIVSALKGNMPNGEDCSVCIQKNLDYPFICECTDDPVKCITGTSCKDCKQYGEKKSDSERLVIDNDSERKAVRRPTSTATRIVRPS